MYLALSRLSWIVLAAKMPDNRTWVEPPPRVSQMQDRSESSQPALQRVSLPPCRVVKSWGSVSLGSPRPKAHNRLHLPSVGIRTATG